MQDQNEKIIKRLNNPEVSDSILPGWIPETVSGQFDSEEAAKIALQRVKEVVLAIVMIQKNSTDWPTDEKWRKILPEWLLKTFRPDFTKEELDLMLKTKHWSHEWTLKGWIGSYRDKVWEWWDGKIDSSTLLVEILVDGHPFSIAELQYLLEASGAKKVKLVDR